ncbi:hypothetical protein EDC30_10728 [Paucimonas lemoignei]|uniref:Uncharacterized protein n=1 Tax=Paucimonas lemoignei TaxID=29443 RepID=A0A4R3HVH7_PAULE|nr:hypothetical protein [Paucimonas lemoignei]TCS36211.1 hypothetical protein EDC30_10728 [Paucimonas lemoignei]
MQADHPSRLIQVLQLLGLLCLLFWRWATPFWRFRDVNLGTFEQRSANYRHNRAQRAILPSYTLKWLGIAACMLILLQIYSGMLAQTMEGTPAYFCAALFCISSGIAFSFACVVIAILLACYFFFTHIKD